MATVPGLINYDSAVKQTTPALAGQATLPAATTYDPATATAAKANTTSWQVDTPQTVAGQIKSVIDTNSPLMQQAETSAKQAANSRGLLNSSLAVGAAQDAVIRTALPIAQQDAQTNVSAAHFNADTANTTAKFNAGNEQQVGLVNMDASNQSRQFGAQQKNAMAITQEEMNLKTNMANLDTLTRTNIASMDAANKVDLANIQASYQNQIQTSQDAAKLWGTHMDEIYKINSDTNITDPKARANLIAGSLQRAKDGMALLSAISNINIRSVLA